MLLSAFEKKIIKDLYEDACNYVETNMSDCNFMTKYRLLNGYNLDVENKMFDFDWENLILTIKDNVILDSNIDFYDENDCYVGMFDLKEIDKLC